MTQWKVRDFIVHLFLFLTHLHKDYLHQTFKAIKPHYYYNHL